MVREWSGNFQKALQSPYGGGQSPRHLSPRIGAGGIATVTSRIIDRIKRCGVPGFHTLVMDRPMRDFEVATLILSAKAYQLFVGPITLFADAEGMKWAVKNKITSIYSDCREIRVPEYVDRRKFWAAGKLESWSRMKAPCVSVDIDAVLYESPSLFKDIIALHAEPDDLQVYQRSTLRTKIDELTGKMHSGYRSKFWHPPANVGILCINDDSFRNRYASLSMDMMSRESVSPLMADYEAIQIEGMPVTQMVLVEQYLLSALATAQNKSMAFIGALNPDNEHMRPNKAAYHLWNSKRYYSTHARARERYIDFTLDELSRIGAIQSVGSILAANGLPTVRVTDGNTQRTRWSYRPEWTGPGDQAVVSE